MNDSVFLVAYVRRARRAAVGQALRALEVGGWTEADVVGHGHAASGHGVENTRFEIVVTAERANDCVAAIAAAAHTGEMGDGMILSSRLDAVWRISEFSAAPGKA